jgi:hypothetical protein
MLKFAERFPKAVLVDDKTFVELIQDKAFMYRPIPGEIAITLPSEGFQRDGRYAFGHRPTYGGTYSIQDGIVSLYYAGENSFLGLGKKRIFFLNGSTLFTARADRNDYVVEMIPNP